MIVKEVCELWWGKNRCTVFWGSMVNSAAYKLGAVQKLPGQDFDHF